MRRVTRPSLFAVVLLLLLAQVAFGAKPFHERFTIDETFDEELCGVSVTTHVQVRVNAHVFGTRVIDVSRALITFTNADGDWLQNHVAGQVTIDEHLDGDILTITFRHTGIAERLRSSAGLTPAFDRGQIVFRDVIDLNDLANEEDDVFLSSEVLFQAGPHPEADSGFALFCEIVQDVLG